MPEAERYDLIIVGLGPVGAVAANLAGAAGLRTLVIEQDTAPFNMPRAIVFDAEIMRVFASIGLADEIAAVTKPMGGSVYIGSDGEPIRRFQTRERAPRSSGIRAICSISRNCVTSSRKVLCLFQPITPGLTPEPTAEQEERNAFKKARIPKEMRAF